MVHVHRRPAALLAAFALFLPLAVLPVAPARAEGERGASRLEQRDGVSVLVLEGTPRERGRAQGRALARPILVGASELQGLVKKGFRSPAVHAALLAKFVWPPEITEELDGIVEGVREVVGDAEVPGTGRALRRSDLEGLNTLADLLPFGCSSFTVSGDRVEGGGTLTGRNLDYPVLGSILSTRLVVVRAARDGAHGWATVSWPGVVGCYTGMNDEGVTASIHDVPVGRDVLSRTGFVPRALGLRAVLERTGKGEGFVERAARVLRDTPVIYGNNVPVSAPGGAAILEWGPDREREGGVTVRLPGEGEPLVCTNHWRARVAPSECPRYDALSKALASGRLTPASALEVLRVSNVAGKVLTIHSVVFALEPRRMHVAFARSNERGAAFETSVELDLAALFDHPRRTKRWL